MEAADTVATAMIRWKDEIRTEGVLLRSSHAAERVFFRVPVPVVTHRNAALERKPKFGTLPGSAKTGWTEPGIVCLWLKSNLSLFAFVFLP